LDPKSNPSRVGCSPVPMRLVFERSALPASYRPAKFRAFLVTVGDRSANCSMASSIHKLRWAVESAHRCAARYAGKVTVHEKRGGSTVWYGCVHIFHLTGHPKARRCYSWAIEGYMGHELQILTALHHGPISSPEEAVRAALADNDVRALRTLGDQK